MTTSAHQLVTLTHAASQPDAHIMKAQLEAAGIECFIPEEHGDAVTGINFIRLQVRSADVPEARAILEIAPPRHACTCPDCGRMTGVLQPRPRLEQILAILLLGIPVLWSKRYFTCEVCGREWTER